MAGEVSQLLIQFRQQITDMGQVLTLLYPPVTQVLIITVIRNGEVPQLAPHLQYQVIRGHKLPP